MYVYPIEIKPPATVMETNAHSITRMRVRRLGFFHHIYGLHC
jgi:hypothetical protein